MVETLDEIQKELFIEYQKNGYAFLWSNNGINQPVFDIAELGLITTEISEAIEEIRKKDKEKNDDDLAFECVDIIIRTLNFMSKKGLIASYWIERKHKINMERGKLHGKQI